MGCGQWKKILSRACRSCIYLNPQGGVMSAEQAETGRLQMLLSQIGAGLDRYLSFEHLDAMHAENNWREFLDMPLPHKGVGIDQVARELVDQIIPNGSPVPKPGFSGFITTGATSAATLASTAASIASPQHYMITAFNFLEELSLQWLARMFGIEGMQGVYSTAVDPWPISSLWALRGSAHLKKSEGTLRPMGWIGR
jgi:aromatic-L-amino-acid decarboxylase